MRSFFWVMAGLGAFAGGLVLVSGVGAASGAPQEAAAAAIAVALAVIPYVLARANDELWRKP